MTKRPAANVMSGGLREHGVVRQSGRRRLATITESSRKSYSVNRREGEPENAPVLWSGPRRSAKA